MSVFVSTLFAQQLYIDAFSGYNLTAYQDTPQYSDGTGYVPIGARIGGGLEHVQLGLEYQQQASNPVFEISNELGVRTFDQEFITTYYGGFVRGNLSTLPAYRFGVILMAGVGQYNTEVQQTDFLSQTMQTIKYDKTLGYNFKIGFSSPIYTILHWEFGYQINIVDRPENLGLPAHNAIHHSFQAGLSLNFVFGNVAKKCRRVIDTGASGRGWR